MSDELKPCPWCKGKPETQRTVYRLHDGLTLEYWWVQCDNAKCPVMPESSSYDTEAEAIEAWNTRADDAPELPQDDACAILRRVAADKTAVSSDDLLRYAVGADMVPEALNKIADMIERDYVRRDSIADDAPEHTVDNQADSWERLEADALDYVVRTAKLCHGMGLRHELWQFNPEPLHMHIRQCLDRQAAITERECREQPCNNISCSIALGNQNLIAENRELHKQVDSLTAELKHKQDVCDVQRESFLKLEAENRELQDVCGELERTIENMRGVE